MNIIKVISLALVAAVLSGCMTTGPVAGCYNRHADYDAIQIGITRAELDEAIGEVGFPIDDGRAAIYRYEHVAAGRSRAWWYAWMGYFSLYTLDPILATIERFGVYRPAQRTAMAVFDEQGKLVAFRQMPDRPKYLVGGEEAPPHNNPGPYDEAWKWSTFWGDGRTNCERGES